MKARQWWKTAGWCLILLVVFLAGCAAPSGYRSTEYEGSYWSDIPSSFYDNDPQLQYWYNAPYWMPDAGP
jgi:hypothetical protein